MRPNESFVGQPVRSLQTMLRVLAERDDRYTPIVPDGVYSPQTMAAVSNFQQNHGLPVTGITNQETWEAIVAEYEPALTHVDQAQVVEIILNPNEIIRRGQSSPYLYIAQAMLLVLSQVYGTGMPSQSGLLDAPTADALASFQALNNLPMTGELDKVTWKHLALHFPLAANLSPKFPEYSEEFRPK